MDFEGIVIAESLHSGEVLNQVEIVSTAVETISDTHMTPWLSQWTCHTVRVPEARAPGIAEALSYAIDAEHANSWYADFKNDVTHYVIYHEKVFVIDRRSEAQYRDAVEYGVSRGLPPHQADFIALIE